MSSLHLYLGSKSLSSWSLRPWLFLRHHRVRFSESVIALDRPETRAQILRHSPSGRVPALVYGQTRIWDSLAICEYAAETFALPGAWPLDPAARAFARSVACEMHAGFAALRSELPFDTRRDRAPVACSDAAQADIERICAIWRSARSRATGADWLFGPFGIVDAMFAPVALRFERYAVRLGTVEQRYVDTVLRHPAVQEWIKAAAAESPAPQPARPAAPSQPVPDVPAAKAASTSPTETPQPPVPVVAAAPAATAAAEATPPSQVSPIAAAAKSAAETLTPKPQPTPHDDIGEDELPPSRKRAATSGAATAAAGDGRENKPEPRPKLRSFILPPD